MKKLLIAFCSITLILSCSHKNNLNEQKMKECIAAYLTTGAEQKDKPEIDSIGIVSADTLTQKNSLKMALDRKYSILKDQNAIYASKVLLREADSALLASLQQQAALYKKNGENYDDASLAMQVEKMKTDSLGMLEILNVVQQTKNAIDSIGKIYTSSDSVSFFAWYVSANIFLKGGSQVPRNYTISADWKVSR